MDYLTVLPQPTLYPDWRDWGSAVISQLENILLRVESTGAVRFKSGTVTLRDSLNRPIVTEEGFRIYATSGTAVVSLGVIQINTEQLVNASIITSKLAPGAVNAEALASLAVQAYHILQGAIGTEKIADGAVSSSKITVSAITADKIEAGAVITGKIAAGAVTTDKITASAITADKIQSGAVIAGKLAAGAIVAYDGVIANAAITSALIGDAQILNAHVLSLHGNKIEAGTITTNKLTVSVITANYIDANAVTAEKIAAGSITADKITAGAVTADKIAAGSVTADKIAAGSITTDKITAGAITASKISVTTLSSIVTKTGNLDVSTDGSVRGGQTDYNTGVGFFLGYSGGAYKFSIGNPSGNYLTWDGSTLAIRVGSGSSIDYAYVSGTKPPANADNTSSAINAGVSITAGGITLSNGGSVKGGQTDYNTGTGFFLGYSGGAYKFSIGNPSGSRLTWDGSTLTFTGSLSGASGTFAGTLTAANAVVTGNLVADAISKVNSVYAESSTLFNSGDTIVSATSDSSSSGNPRVIIDFGVMPQANLAHILKLYRDTTLIATFNFTTGYPATPFAFTVSDNPGDASAHTYALKNESGAGRYFTNRSIVVTTHKR